MVGRKLAPGAALFLCFVILFLLPLGGVTGQSGNIPPLSPLHRELTELDAREREVLAEIFALGEEIRSLEQELAAVEEERDQLTEDLEEVEIQYQEAVAALAVARETAGQALRWLQRLGPVSYVDILVGAVSWRDFWRRLDITMVAVGGLERTLQHLAQAREGVVQKREALADRDRELARLAAAAAEKLEGLERARGEREAYLAGLGQEREGFEDRLHNLEALVIQDTLPYLEVISLELARVLLSGETLAHIQWQLSRDGLRGQIPFSRLNASMAGSPALEGISLSGRRGSLVLSAPARGLLLEGDLLVDDTGTGIHLVVNKVQVWEIPLSKSTWEEPIGDIHFPLSLRAPVGGVKLRNIWITEEALNLAVGFQ